MRQFGGQKAPVRRMGVAMLPEWSMVRQRNMKIVR